MTLIDSIDYSEPIPSSLEDERTTQIERSAIGPAPIIAVPGLRLMHVIHELKTVSHIWGIKGSVLLNRQWIPLDGYNEKFIKSLFIYQRAFLTELPPDNLFHHLNKSIADIHKTASLEEAEKLTEKILKGDTVFVPLASVDHMHFLVFATLEISGKKHHMVYKCNRGFGAKTVSGVIVYKIHDLKKIKETLEFIQEDKSTEEASSLFNHQIDYLLDLEPLDYLRMKEQKTNNCVKASTNAAFYALLYHTALIHFDGNSLKAQDVAHATYKRFTKRLRISSFIKLLKNPWHTEYMQHAICDKISQSKRFTAQEKNRLFTQIAEKLVLHHPAIEAIQLI